MNLQLNFEAPKENGVAWNPRFLAFARVHGRTPHEQGTFDEERWLGGRMCGFQLWVSARWDQYRKARRIAGYDPLGPEDHAAFDAENEQLPPCTGCMACGEEIQ